VTRQPPRSSQAEGSTLRLLAGAVLIIVALATTLVGFARLIRVLEGGGYGTSAMLGALLILAAAGAFLAAGIATVIWDIAKRHGRS
jgi:Na+-transporting NADH:ubiquinone oxidoreductase subunit NqrD